MLFRSYYKPEEAALKVEDILKLPHEILSMGKNGRDAVLQKYNWNRESEKLVVAYKKLLS